MPDQVDGRKRLLGAARSAPSRAQLVAAVLLAVLGFAAVVQVQSNDRDEQYLGARQGDLVALINNLSLAAQRTETQIAQLQRTRESLQSDTQAKKTAISRANEQLVELGILAGTIRATGPGIEVTVTDPSGGIGTDQILNGIEELRDAGAEAMQLNGKVRLVAQSWVSDDPNGGLLVDGVHLSPPYVLDVIGDPHTLATALKFSGGFVDEVHQQGGVVVTRQSNQVEVDSLVKPKTPVYAIPVPKR
jgi:uncharacterized protein YlxW (UPF0749 family)